MGSVTALIPYRPVVSARLPREREGSTETRPAPAPGQQPAPGYSAQGTRSAGRQHRPSAAFLAQLIAARRNLPQARERRRAEPGEAIAAYAAAMLLGSGKAA
jgi:hypothetical protein